jgi:hypothetical protein
MICRVYIGACCREKGPCHPTLLKLDTHTHTQFPIDRLPSIDSCAEHGEMNNDCKPIQDRNRSAGQRDAFPGPFFLRFFVHTDNTVICMGRSASLALFRPACLPWILVVTLHPSL